MAANNAARNLSQAFPRRSRSAASTKSLTTDGSLADFSMVPYTIDLGALGVKPSSSIVQDRQQQGDQVPSECGGPEDFTLNLLKYMKGEKQWTKPGQHNQTPVNNTQNNEISKPQEQTHDSYVDNHACVTDVESIFEPDAESTPSSRRGSDTQWRRTESILEMKAAESKAKASTEDQATQEMFERLAVLQQEVEKMREEEELRLPKQQDLERENAKLKTENHKAQQRINQLEQLQRSSREPSQERTLDSNLLSRELAKSKERVKDLMHQAQQQQSRTNTVQADFDAYRERSLTDTARLEDELREQTAIAKSESRSQRTE